MPGFVLQLSNAEIYSQNVFCTIISYSEMFVEVRQLL